MASENTPSDDFKPDSYVSPQDKTKNESVPVQSDKDDVEDPLAGDQNTDEQLVRDDNEAIDKANIMEDRTRHAAKPAGTYREPGDDEGIPVDD